MRKMPHGSCLCNAIALLSVEVPVFTNTSVMVLPAIYN
jgi:hypothetical protein